MEKENKYYEVIENLIKAHKKFPGLEPIIEDIIDDVYSHSEVIISTINNDAVVNAYLAKVVSTSIITVPKRMNFHNETKPRVIVPPITPEIKQEVTKVDNNLVDKMINSSEKTEVIIPAEEEKEEDLIIEEVIQPEIIEEVAAEPLEEKQEIVSEIEPEELIEEINLNEYKVEVEEETEVEAEQPLLFEEETVLEEISDNVEQEAQEEFAHEEELLLEEPEEEVVEELILEEPGSAIEEIIEENEPVEPAFSQELTDEVVNLETNDIDELQEEEFEPPLEFEDVQEETLEETEVETELESENVTNESFAVLEEEPLEELTPESKDTQNEIMAEVEELPEVSEDDLSLDFNIQEETLEITEEPLLVEENDQQDELLPEEDTFEALEDNSITLDTFSNDDDLTEFIVEEPQELELSSETNESVEEVNFAATDYSRFEFTPDNTESEQSFDVDLIVKELTELDNKKPELSILEIYNLKYKDNMPVSEISSKLDISENRVIEALNEIIAVL